MLQALLRGTVKQGTKITKKKKPPIKSVEKGQELETLKQFNSEYAETPDEPNESIIEDAIDTGKEAVDQASEKTKKGLRFDVDEKLDELVSNRKEEEPKNIGEKAVKKAKQGVKAIKDLPTPAGIGLLLVLILLLLFAVQTVKVTENGRRYTRLGLIFKTLIGEASIDGFDADSEKPGTRFSFLGSDIYETEDGIKKWDSGDAWYNDAIDWTVNGVSGAGQEAMQPISNWVNDLVQGALD